MTLLTTAGFVYRKAVAASIAVAALVLTGCANAPAPVNYAPTSIKTIQGSLTIAPFTYLPASPKASKVVPANVIRNTAMGEFKIDKDVSTFVRDAVFLELRTMGAKMDNPAKVLNGEIEEFLVDDLGYSVDWTLRIKYTVTESASKQVLFTSVKNTQRKTAKFVNPFGALNETLKLNTEQLVDDPEFLKSIR